MGIFWPYWLIAHINSSCTRWFQAFFYVHPDFGGNDSIRQIYVEKNMGGIQPPTVRHTATATGGSVTRICWGHQDDFPIESTTCSCTLDLDWLENWVGPSHFWMFSILGDGWNLWLWIFGASCIFIGRWLKQAVAILHVFLFKHYMEVLPAPALTQLYIQHRHQVLL